VFAPDRLVGFVSGYLDQAKADAQLHRSQLGQIRSALTEVEGAIKRLVIPSTNGQAVVAPSPFQPVKTL